MQGSCDLILKTLATVALLLTSPHLRRLQWQLPVFERPVTNT